ncbi:efflux RND transporter periplasmic adaptor subunit [Vulcaniibacterium gelatinicum]|uniref:efflux RND transporter periplasmic adaptor subunit n=1 Tax=Vulcaniibacterium gelatinicum TaxID=2598725 RepID=UPI001FE57F88|nr:efflux RND transporter periplasmic adaptor subunit [Vulcaniibacterium gelatinicum]
MRLLAAALLPLALAACGGTPPQTPAREAPALETIVVGTAADGGGRAWDGVVEAVRQADLAAQTAGRVTEVTVDVGDRVRAGAVLLRLTAVEQQAGVDTARAQLRAAEAAAAEAETNYRRYAALAESRYVSGAQLDQARAARDAAVAARDAARAQLAQAGQQAAYTVVRAPLDGVVHARHVEPGEAVAPGQPLLAVHAPGALRIEVQVPQSDAAVIRKAGRAAIVLADGRRVDAAQTIVFPAADPATHSVGVRVLLPALDDAPRPGSTAKVVFPIAGAGAPILAIPRTALVQRGEVSGVYVVAGRRIALRQVRPGRTFGDRVEVLSGLKPGERIARDPVAAVQALVAQRNAEAGDD